MTWANKMNFGAKRAGLLGKWDDLWHEPGLWCKIAHWASWPASQAHHLKFYKCFLKITCFNKYQSKVALAFCSIKMVTRLRIMAISTHILSFIQMQLSIQVSWYLHLVLTKWTSYVGGMWCFSQRISALFQPHLPAPSPQSCLLD